MSTPPVPPLGPMPEEASSPDPGSARPAFRMDPRQRTIHESLRQIDPELAGLFAQGCELTARIDEPGVRYLIAHAGRELSKAVLDAISRELPAVAEKTVPFSGSKDETTLRQEIADIFGVDASDPRIDTVLDTFGENHRVTIARALGVGPLHPLVTA